ncbi:PucR family transcriptional regulator [Mycolicibacterium sp. CBM1]
MPVRHTWIRDLAPPPRFSLEPACSAATVAAAEAELGAGPVAWTVDISARIAAANEGGSLGHAASLAQSDERANCEACVLALLRGLYAGVGPSALVIPAEVWESNQRALRRGMPFATLLQNAWHAHSHLQQELLNMLVNDTVAATSPEGTLRMAADVNQTMTAYFDALWKKSTEEWDYHQRDWEQHAALAKREAVLSIIDGTADVDEVEGVVGLKLTSHHVAIVVGTDETQASASALTARLRRALTDAAKTLAAQITVVEMDNGMLGAWLSLPTAPSDRFLMTVRELLVDLPAAWCAVGPTIAGAKGFRRSYLVAARLGRHAQSHPRDGNTVLGLDSVRAASLLVDDLEFAGWFVRDTLGGLVGVSPKDQDLRETLLQYLSSGRSPRLVAEKMHVAPNTVAYRVKRAEQLLARDSGDQPLDVMLALSLASDLPELLAE